ncbi:hypothetical protein [Flavobacterium sp.]|uniref:hypothetical protein n=1 Tax=Flavobacterium sp. TaxID=239 RepID=UPI003D2AADA6
MKTIILKTTLLTALLFLTTSFNDLNQKTGNNEGYHFIHVFNPKAKQVFISNVFYCTEMPSRSEIYDLIENDLNYNVEDIYACNSSYHEEKNYMIDARNKEIQWANNRNLKVIKFELFCKNEKIYLK